MVTDWLLIRRLGFELERRLRGARFSAAGLLADGRIALALRSRGENVAVVIDVHGSPPAVTLEAGEPVLGGEPGFARAVAAALRGTTLTSVRARRADRLLRLSFGSRSRFGVDDEIDLYLELVPRFGNAILVKRGTVVAAAKEFSLADNGRRAVQAGMAYELPPLPPETALVPKIVGDSIERDAFLELAAGDEAMERPLFVYSRDGAIAQAHVLPLPGFENAALSREGSLLDVLDALRVQERGRGERERSQRRRTALLKRLDEREAKIRAELASLDAKRRRAAQRDALRAQGEDVFATLHELPEAQREEAKDRAAALFAEYKKLGAGLPHFDRRESSLRAALDVLAALHWEAERVAPEDLDDVESGVAGLDPQRRDARRSGGTVRKRKRAPLEFRTASGSRIVVGRSPAENAELTFKLARPNDLWFHAQGIPGAHVVLARDDRSDAPEADVEAAAALAAFYSKGKASTRVAIDYTLRKHVRKQQNAPPGLVWYTHPKTVTVEPRDSP